MWQKDCYIIVCVFVCVCVLQGKLYIEVVSIIMIEINFEETRSIRRKIGGGGGGVLTILFLSPHQILRVYPGLTSMGGKKRSYHQSSLQQHKDQPRQVKFPSGCSLSFHSLKCRNLNLRCMLVTASTVRNGCLVVSPPDLANSLVSSIGWVSGCPVLIVSALH